MEGKMRESLSRPKIWEDEYVIRFFEVDARRKILFPSLWKFMQETAWNHANHIGIGYSDLTQSDHFWVLSRLSIEMKDYPSWGDQVKVKTWLLGGSRLFALRDFSVVTQDGRIIGGAKSAWVVLDQKSRKPQRIEPFLEGLSSLPDQHGTEVKLDKLPVPAHPDRKASFTVRYSDLDVNLHANSVKYMEWILDSYPLEINQTHHIATFEINFLAESGHGEELYIHSELQKALPPTTLHQVIRKEDGRELCRARVSWRKRE